MSTMPQVIFVVSIDGSANIAFGQPEDAEQWKERNRAQYVGREIVIKPVHFTMYATYGVGG